MTFLAYCGVCHETFTHPVQFGQHPCIKDHWPKPPRALIREPTYIPDEWLIPEANR